MGLILWLFCRLFIIDAVPCVTNKWPSGCSVYHWCCSLCHEQMSLMMMGSLWFFHFPLVENVSRACRVQFVRLKPFGMWALTNFSRGCGKRNSCTFGEFLWLHVKWGKFNVVNASLGMHFLLERIPNIGLLFWSALNVWAPTGFYTGIHCNHHTDW